MLFIITLKKHALWLMCTMFFLQTEATIRYVIQGNPTSPGASWGAASGDLQQILGLSVAGDEIWVRYGTYKPSTTALREASFYLKEGVKIYGGFLGFEANLIQRQLVPGTETFLSGDVDATGNFDSFHVLRSPANNSTITNATVIDGFTITGGRADYADAADEKALGGALYLAGNASPVFSHCNFTNNAAVVAGAIYATGTGNLQLNACRFYGNMKLGGDLAAINIFVNGLSISATDCLFQSVGSGDNHAIFLASESGSIVPHIFSFQRCSFKQSGFHYGIVEYALGNKDTTRLSNCVFLGTDAGANKPSILNNGNSFFEITNSTFYNYNFFLTVAYESKLANNIFWEGGVYKGSAPALTPNITHNIIHMGNAACYYCPGAANPLFVNAADPDGADDILGTPDDGLRLYSNSPAVKAGMDLGGGQDVTGTAYTLPINLGAYEGSVCYNAALTRLYVNAAVSGGDGSGSNWQNAMPQLRTALNAASGCNGITQIWVAAGTYKTSTIGDRAQSFYMRNDLAIYGGFAGTEIFLGQRNWKKNITILSGDIDAAGTNDAKTVLFNRSVNNTAIIEGFTITGGHSETTNGGGISNASSSPVIRNCLIKENSAGGYGGGMYNGNSDPTVINCAFFKNAALQGGGAVYNSFANPQMRNCVFTLNSTSGHGGAIFNSLTSANNKLINCTVYYNEAALGSGGVYNYFGSPAITNCIFWKNGGAGEEILNGSNSNPTVSYSHIQGGYAPCTNCTIAALSPKFIDSSIVNGPNGQSALEGWDGVFGTIDDGLQLQYGSPCIDAGNDAVLVDVTDISGDKRQDGTHVNLGAYETVPIMSVQNGNWNAGSTWNTATVPLAENRVIINPTHTVTINAAYDAFCRSMWLRTGGEIPGGRLVIPASSSLRLKP